MDAKCNLRLRKVNSPDPVINVNKTPFTIGRQVNSNIMIADKLISRTHCTLLYTENEGWILKDSSSNGTYVNKVHVQKDSIKLKPGDVILVTPDEMYSVEIDPLLLDEIEIPDDVLCNLADKVEALEENKAKNDSSVQILDSGEPSPKKAKIDKPDELDKKKINVSAVDDELTCSICSEMFIKTVTLNCSHSFCSYCIGEWKKNKNICPICRGKITSITPTLVLDNLIEKVQESGTEEEIARRLELVTERAKIEPGPSRTTATVLAQAGGVPIEVLSSDDSYEVDLDLEADSDYDGYNEWSDDGYDDEPVTYYGGYGSCFVCGEPDHWANTCPLRDRRRY